MSRTLNLGLSMEFHILFREKWRGHDLGWNWSWTWMSYLWNFEFGFGYELWAWFYICKFEYHDFYLVLEMEFLN